jgi:hypothetical protein
MTQIQKIESFAVFNIRLSGAEYFGLMITGSSRGGLIAQTVIAC